MWISEEERKQHSQQDARWQRIKDLQNSRKPKNKRRRHKKQIKQQQEFVALQRRTEKYLSEFWPKFNDAKTDTERLDLLKRAANPPWERVSGKMRTRCRRDKGLRMTILFSELGVEKCATCYNKPSEKHHIVPCCYGGPTIKENLVMICWPCHDVIHPWMKS